jgi:hypothetical protein
MNRISVRFFEGSKCVCGGTMFDSVDQHHFQFDMFLVLPRVGEFLSWTVGTILHDGYVRSVSHDYDRFEIMILVDKVVE